MAHNYPMAQKKKAAKTDDDQTCHICGQVHLQCTAHAARKKDSQGRPIPCKWRPVRGKTVCRYHGGKSLSGPAHGRFKDGRHSVLRPVVVVDDMPRSKAHYFQDPEMYRRSQALAQNVVENLEESVRIAAMLETRAIERLETGESTAAWKLLKDRVREYDDATFNSDYEAMAQAFGGIRWAVETGLKEAAAVSDIQRLQEHQRKLAETAVKTRMQLTQNITTEDMQMFLAVFTQEIRRIVNDRKILNELGEAVERHGATLVANRGRV